MRFRRMGGDTWRGQSGMAMVLALALVGACGIAIGVGLGVVAIPSAIDPIQQTGTPAVFAAATHGSGADPEAMARADRIVADVLASAPGCEPDIRMAGAPTAEREEFLEEAEQLANDAVEVQGLRNVAWDVVEHGDHLYGVLYGERCD